MKLGHTSWHPIDTPQFQHYHKHMKKKRGRPPKPKGTTVKKINISITPERLAKVDSRGANRSRVIGKMIDAG